MTKQFFEKYLVAKVSPQSLHYPCDLCERSECIGVEWCEDLIGNSGYWYKNPDYKDSLDG